MNLHMTIGRHSKFTYFIKIQGAHKVCIHLFLGIFTVISLGSCEQNSTRESSGTIGYAEIMVVPMISILRGKL